MMMGAFVGEMSSYKWFEWACEAKICKPGDEVRRMILDIGIDDAVIVYIEKYTDSEHIEVRLPEIQHVRRVDKGTTRVVGVKDGFYVRELTPVGREMHDLKAEVARLTNELVELAAKHSAEK
jgi:hypothetical protein